MSRTLIILIAAMALCHGAFAQEPPRVVPLPSPGVNLAKGKPCTFDPAPNYGLCTDAGDATDLTDGVYNGCEWREQGTVGWNVGRSKTLTINLDLGSDQPIGKITFNTVTGGAQVTFPSAVLVFLSSDGKEYRFVGDVLSESLPQEQYLNHRFALDGLKAWGRYVRLVILPGGFYVFCDEIEVMKGEHTAAQAKWADDKPLADGGVVEYALAKKPWVDQKNSTLALLRNASEAVEERVALGAKAQGAEAARKTIAQARAEVLTTADVQEADYWSGPPYRGYDRLACGALGRMNAALWPQGRVRLWQDKGWSWLKPFAAPKGPAPQIRIEMMGNEWQCASLNVTSCSDQSQELTLKVAEFTGPQKLPAGVLSVGQIIHTEAFGYNFRDDMIVPVAAGGKINVPAGLSKRLWLTFKTRGMDLKPGVYTSTITVSIAGKQVGQVPLRLRISPLRFPDQPVCESNTWGYYYEKAIAGRELEASQNLRDHYNTSLVINHAYLPYPKPDAQGNFTVPLDFTKLDQMIEWYPDCRMWLLWAGWEFGFDRLGTAKFGTPVWEKVFEQWVTQIRDHLAEKGIGRDKFAWYWIDEPGEKAWNERCVPTSQLLKRLDPQMLTWEDPVGGVTAQMLEDALPYFDMYCPPIGYADPARIAVCRQTRRPSWLYACASEKNSDPTAYYRWLVWTAFKLGLGGVGMWVYVDANSVHASDYIGGVSYSLIYGGPTGILNSKRWEAWRQGIGDFEYLTMLRAKMTAAKAAGGKAAAVAEAEKLLTEGVDGIVGESPHGGDATKPAAPDEMRVRMLECLERL
jgi:hypothetical protein